MYYPKRLGVDEAGPTLVWDTDACASRYLKATKECNYSAAVLINKPTLEQNHNSCLIEFASALALA